TGGGGRLVLAAVDDRHRWPCLSRPLTLSTDQRTRTRPDRRRRCGREVRPDTGARQPWRGDVGPGRRPGDSWGWRRAEPGPPGTWPRGRQTTGGPDVVAAQANGPPGEATRAVGWPARYFSTVAVQLTMPLTIVASLSPASVRL